MCKAMSAGTGVFFPLAREYNKTKMKQAVISLQIWG